MVSVRPTAVFLVLFILFSGSLALHLSTAAPVGSWRTLAFNAYDIEDNADPDGLYLPSAVQFDDSGRFPFILGTPGVTLHYLLYGAAKGYYFFASPSNVGFLEFCAKNWDRVNVVSRVACAAVVIGSICLLFILLQRLGLGFEASALAALLYFFSFPVLIYFNKITPEGLMVLFYLLDFWFLIEYRKSKKLYYIVLAALCCMLALFSKIHYLFMLPFINILYIKIVNKSAPNSHMLAFLATAMLATLLLSLHLEVVRWCSGWLDFISYYYKNLTQLTGGRSPLENSSTMTGLSFFASLFCVASSFVADIFLLHVGKNEVGFVVLSLLPLFFFGGLGIVRHRKWSVEDGFLATTVLCGMPIVLFRGGYHYWYFCILLASVHAGRYLCGHLLRLTAKWQPAVWAVALSMVSITIFLYAKSFDIASYAKNSAPYYQALHAVDYGQRVGIVRSAYSNTKQRLGGFYLSFGIGEDLRLVRKFYDQFAEIDSTSEEALYRNYVFAWVTEDKTGYDVVTCPSP